MPTSVQGVWVGKSDTDVSAGCMGQEKQHGTLVARYCGRKAVPIDNTKRNMKGIVLAVTPWEK